MLSSVHIARLFENVLQNDMCQYNISSEAIKLGIECMAHVYKADTVSWDSERSMVADYTDAAHRCAYLHKYAAFHTVMVRDMLHAAIMENFGFFYQLIFSGRDHFRICSLGGGPGSDIIGALAALHAAYSYFETSATVIDYMVDWKFSFDSILRELGSGWYGAFGNNTSYYLNWRYVGANLLKAFKPEVIEALSSASLVTMIKFASAAKCQDTEFMIKNIFAAMKPGAALLFIDNDGGGFHNLMMNAVNEFNFIPVYGPFRRENYTHDLMKVKRFGYLSCFKTTVTVHVLQKPFSVTPYVDNHLYVDNHDRRVIVERPFIPNGPSFIGSPLTPMLFRPDYTHDENANDLVPRRPSLLESPQTPMLRRPHFTQDDYINRNLPYIDSHDRRVIIERPFTPNGPSLLGSPLTPMLFHPDYTHNENVNALVPRRPSLLGPPHTPMLFRSDFTRDEDINNPDFSSPEQEIPQSPCYYMRSRVATPMTNNILNSPFNFENSRPVIFTPDTQPKKRKRRSRSGKKVKQGCLPLKSFRHHLSRKVNQVKTSARTLFKKKVKDAKAHPIFRL